MSSITDHIKEMQASLPKGVTLVAVSKFHPVEALQEAYDAGQRIFGESRAQELCAKQKVMPNDIEWHFIGPLQSNKVKEIIPFISMIQSIDTVKLLSEVNKQAARCNRVISVLLEMHIAQEEAKHGFNHEECEALLHKDVLNQLSNVRICGLMGMATNTDNSDQVRKEFHGLHDYFLELKNGFFKDDDFFKTLSMGMTQDYDIAVEEGSTMIRVGTHIFGERQY